MRHGAGLRVFVATLALAALTGSCDDTSVTSPVVVSVSVTPARATVVLGQSIRLTAIVEPATANAVVWTSSNEAVARVDTLGNVLGVSGGIAWITATSKTDALKSAAAEISVFSQTPRGPLPIFFANVTDTLLKPVNLAKVAGRIIITMNSAAGTIDVFLASIASCGSSAIAAADIKAATLQVPSPPQSSTHMLTVNTAAVTATTPAAPLFLNGQYCLKARLTTATGEAVTATVLPITLNN